MRLKQLRKDINRRAANGEHFSRTELRALSLEIVKNCPPSAKRQRAALKAKHKA